MTFRQYDAWQEWLDEEDDRPSRIEQILTLALKSQWGLEFVWRRGDSTKAKKPVDPNKSDVGVVMSGLGGLMDFSKIKGGDILAKRLEEMKKRGEL